MGHLRGRRYTPTSRSSGRSRSRSFRRDALLRWFPIEPLDRPLMMVVEVNDMNEGVVAVCETVGSIVDYALSNLRAVVRFPGKERGIFVVECIDVDEQGC